LIQYKSPLRYPGGKQRAIKYLDKFLPPLDNIVEYREPFLGGGSMFFHIRSKKLNSYVFYMLNDLNQEVFYFWDSVQFEREALVELIRERKKSTINGRELYNYLVNLDVEALSPVERAARFFILNRITYSGTIESGGYSESAFKTRFTESSIERIELLKEAFRCDKSDIMVTSFDYEVVLDYYSIKKEDKTKFVFLDPPYYGNVKSKLYGIKGDLHTTFDHDRLAKKLLDAGDSYLWLLTIDDCEEVRTLYSPFKIHEWELQYSMGKPKKGKELIITNY